VLSGTDLWLKRQRVVFVIVDLSLIAILLLLHTVYASFWGQPSTSLRVLLGACFLIRAGELAWLRGRALGLRASAALSWVSIAFDLLLAFALATLVDREDSQYFAILVVPVLESAFRFGLWRTVGVVAAADGVAFYWVWRYFNAHPPTDVGEYFEAGTISIIFLIVGVLICVMMRQLQRKQEELAANASELERTRARLQKAETLAAVGRISAAVAHEIRNPVAMIASSISTARKLTGPDRDEMFEIAAKEAGRLVNLTSDLLNYARPRRAATVSTALWDTVLSIVEACRAHAEANGVAMRVQCGEEVTAAHDAGLVRQVLMNLVMNAVDASIAGGTVDLSVTAPAGGAIRINVENMGGPIPAAVVDHLFEPFFTTKPAGTGLGLAAAHNAAVLQGCNLLLANNSDRVCFSLVFPPSTQAAELTAS